MDLKRKYRYRHRLMTIVRGLVFGGAIEFQQGVDLDFPDFIAAEFVFDGSDGVLSTATLPLPDGLSGGSFLLDICGSEVPHGV